MNRLHALLLVACCATLPCCSKDSDGSAEESATADSELQVDSQPDSGDELIERPPPADGPNVLLFVIDTLRADRLGCYGNEAGPSPQLDALAAEGVLFEQAIAPSPYTAASHASLFTSIHPVTHGVWNRIKLENGHNVFPALAENAVTLAEVLRDAGWETAAIADGGYVNERRGLDQGFNLFDSKTLWVRNRIDRALKWLEEERAKDRPFFLFLHTYEVHYPYLPDDEYIERFGGGYEGRVLDAVHAGRAAMGQVSEKNPIGDIQRQFFKPIFDSEMSDEERNFVRNLYDAEIAMTDDHFARVLNWLRENEMYEDTILIITSDHGEQLWEHGSFGHHQVWQEQVHIPLIFRIPGGSRGVRRVETVELLDVMPTLLDALGLPIPAQTQGRVIALDDRPAPAETRAHFSAANWPLNMHAWRQAQSKVVTWPDGQRDDAVFDLSSDPGEQQNLAHTEASMELLRSARRWLAGFNSSSSDLRDELNLFPTIHALTAFSPDMIEELAVLGYVDSEEEEEPE